MNNPIRRDTLFASPLGQIDGFTFDAQVAAVFPDMLDRSIPGYQTIIAQTGLLAARYAKPGTHCYDLGCSLGATSLAIRSNLSSSEYTIIAVDSSSAMLAAFEQNLQPDDGLAAVELHCEDIYQTRITNASVVALNFTLQFIDQNKRQTLLSRISDGMVKGGVLVLSEKVVFPDAELNQLYIDMYHEFKRANGYSDLEISQKRTALENVLVPDTIQQHHSRLMEAGFTSVSVWFQCFNFVSIVALK